ncbi:MAG: hypothetical protein QM775_30870 [Pirellulales bacterium]
MPETISDARMALRDCIFESLPTDGDPLRQRFFLRLLPQVGQTLLLVELASSGSEQLKELGLIGDVQPIVEAFVQDESQTPEDRFWALDTLVLWSYERQLDDRTMQLLDSMEALAAAHPLTVRARGALATKRMHAFAKRGDLDGIHREYEIGKESIKDEADHVRVVKYNFGLSLYLCGRNREAANVAQEVIAEYYDTLGLSPADVFAKNPPEIWAKIENKEEATDNLRRLADSLDLYAKSLQRMGQQTGLVRIHAHKFYVMANAYQSAVRLGQDFVDECLSERRSPRDARRFLESNLIPYVMKAGLVDHVIQVRSHYAVILAYCGEFSLAARKCGDSNSSHRMIRCGNSN